MTARSPCRREHLLGLVDRPDVDLDTVPMGVANGALRDHRERALANGNLGDLATPGRSPEKLLRHDLQRPLTTADIIAERCGVRPLAVDGDTANGSDFLNLSRRHAIDVDAQRAHLSIFGGKLTDCLNVGDEVCDRVASLGVSIDGSVRCWYGEPGPERHAEFLRRAAVLRLDQRTVQGAAEPLSQRLWRRYGARAFDLLDRIGADATQAEVLIEGTEYLRCEIEETAAREMIVRLEDFLRRRSKIALVTREAGIRSAPGLMRPAGRTPEARCTPPWAQQSTWCDPRSRGPRRRPSQRP